ncbi:TAP-like protein-domain-containing protein [Tirmania nivea]|nr:TAP-like protein-domain-containing protein [Tirmania nivea]
MGNMCTGGKRAEEGRYLGTASVARDMLAITDATWDHSKSGIRKGLQYWGFSYGTALGITFATLFPNKVERMIIDGVVDVFDYFALGGLKNLQDTEDVMDSFYIFCSQAGPLKCPFHTGTTPNHIRNRYHTLLTSLRTQPLAYNIAALGEVEHEDQPDIFTYDDLRYLTFQALYSPLTYFLNLTTLLVEVEKRFPEGVLPIAMSGRNFPLTCSVGGNDIANEALRSTEASVAIMCSDASPLTNLTFPFPLYSEKLRTLKAQSPTAADIWASAALPCLGWNVQAKWKPVLSMTHNDSMKRKGGAPILLIGNTADPVTPLANAYSMAKLFPKGGAVVAIQEGEGHCSTSVPTKCMSSIIHTYFGTGKVPEGDRLRCAREVVPFLGDVSTGNMARRDAGRKEARDAMRNIGRTVNRQLAYSGALSKSRFAHLLEDE